MRRVGRSLLHLLKRARKTRKRAIRRCQALPARLAKTRHRLRHRATRSARNLLRRGRSLWRGVREAWAWLRAWAGDLRDAVWIWFRGPNRSLGRLVSIWRHLPFKRAWNSASQAGVVCLDTDLYLDRKIGRPRWRQVEAEIRRVRRTVAAMGRFGHTVVVGPWLGEVGFELLYWIPFLHWAKAYGRLKDDRLVVVSRGGVASWYERVSPNYWEIFDHFSPQEFRHKNRLRISGQRDEKQAGISQFDREIIDRVRSTLEVGDVKVLHPSLMFDLLRLYWTKSAPLSVVESFAFYRKLPVPARAFPNLPEEYVAVKFYGNVAMPDTEANRAFAAKVVGRLAGKTNVVVLDSGRTYDEHDELGRFVGARLYRIGGGLRPQENLAVQTQVIAAARAFYGTYGGFSYLAPLCGVRTVTFYSNPSGFRRDHLELARRVFLALGCPAFLALDVRDYEFLEQELASARTR